MMEKFVIGIQVHQAVKPGVAVLVVTLITHPKQHVPNSHVIMTLQPKSVQQELVKVL